VFSDKKTAEAMAQIVKELKEQRELQGHMYRSIETIRNTLSALDEACRKQSKHIEEMNENTAFLKKKLKKLKPQSTPPKRSAPAAHAAPDQTAAMVESVVQNRQLPPRPAPEGEMLSVPSLRDPGDAGVDDTGSFDPFKAQHDRNKAVKGIQG